MPRIMGEHSAIARQSTGSSGSFAWRRLLLVALEAICVLCLASLLIKQVASTHITANPDPDGYVEYARHLQNHGSLMPHRRLPGYPAALVLFDTLGPGTMHEDTYWAQLGLFVAFSIGSWFCVRRVAGALVAGVYLALFSFPCMLTVNSTLMLSDFVYTLLFVPLLVVSLRWLFSAPKEANWALLVAFFVLSFYILLIRATAFVQLALMLIGAVSAYALGWALPMGKRFCQARQIPVKVFANRVATLAVISMGLLALVIGVFDTGAGDFNKSAVTGRVCIHCPPASDSWAERLIEDQKHALYGSRGVRGRDEKFTGIGWVSPKMRRATKQVYLARLWKHPLTYLRSGLLTAQREHYILAMNFLPFAARTDAIHSSYTIAKSDSVQSALFYEYGIDLPDTPTNSSNKSVIRQGVHAVAWLFGFWAFMCWSIWRCYRRAPAMTLTMFVSIALWLTFLSLTCMWDGRYMMPYAPLIYLAQAVGITDLLLTVCGRLTAAFRQAPSGTVISTPIMSKAAA